MNAEIIAVLIEWSHEVAERVRNEWASKCASVPGLANVDASLPIIIGDYASVTIFGQGMKAWIAEMGSGSLMEKSYAENPWLWDYEKSELWNPLRTGYSIRGREEGDYRDIDGNIRHSSGKMAGNHKYGLNLEQNGWAIPQEPMHIIEQEIKDSISVLYARIGEVIFIEIRKAFDSVPKEIVL